MFITSASKEICVKTDLERLKQGKEKDGKRESLRSKNDIWGKETFLLNIRLKQGRQEKSFLLKTQGILAV